MSHMFDMWDMSHVSCMSLTLMSLVCLLLSIRRIHLRLVEWVRAFNPKSRVRKHGPKKSCVKPWVMDHVLKTCGYRVYTCILCILLFVEQILNMCILVYTETHTRLQHMMNHLYIYIYTSICRTNIGYVYTCIYRDKMSAGSCAEDVCVSLYIGVYIYPIFVLHIEVYMYMYRWFIMSWRRVSIVCIIQ